MKKFKSSWFFLLCGCLIAISGCVSEQEYKDLQVQNNTQQKRIDKLQSQLKATQLNLQKLQRQLDSAESRGDVQLDALRQEIAALEEDLAAKKELIASMQQRLLYGGMALPVELSTKLEDFAKDKDLVTYDSDRGIVKFKSDLLFELGSDEVAAAAAGAVSSLCTILNSKEASSFDIIIAGHTDDIDRFTPATRKKHPNNWYLSAHRAISILDVMSKSNIATDRLSIRAFGEYRPIAKNKPDKKGNPQNRRVEIYIVPKGT